MHRPDVQIIVNTTPCGMFPNVGQCLIDPKAFPALEAVLDVVYNPFRTELLLRAEDCGVTAAGGFEMLVAQAVFAAEHFYRQTAGHGSHHPGGQPRAAAPAGECLHHRDAGLRKIHRRRGAGKAP